MKKRPSLKKQIEDEYIYDDLSSEDNPSRKEKKEHREGQQLKNKIQKKKQWDVSKSVFFASTIILLLIGLIVWSLTLVVAPVHEIPATLSSTIGGFNIEYPILEKDIHEFPVDVEVGDEFFMTDFGRIVNTRRNNLKVVVDKINDNKVVLKVENAQLPTFISMDEFIAYFKDDGKNGQFSSIYVHGKIAGGRFVLSKITKQ